MLTEKSFLQLFSLFFHGETDAPVVVDCLFGLRAISEGGLFVVLEKFTLHSYIVIIIKMGMEGIECRNKVKSYYKTIFRLLSPTICLSNLAHEFTNCLIFCCF